MPSQESHKDGSSNTLPRPGTQPVKKPSSVTHSHKRWAEKSCALTGALQVGYQLQRETFLNISLWSHVKTLPREFKAGREEAASPTKAQREKLDVSLLISGQTRLFCPTPCDNSSSRQNCPTALAAGLVCPLLSARAVPALLQQPVSPTFKPSSKYLISSPVCIFLPQMWCTLS